MDPKYWNKEKDTLKQQDTQTHMFTCTHFSV